MPAPRPRITTRSVAMVTLLINTTNLGSAIVVQQCSANSGTPSIFRLWISPALGRFNATVGRLLVGVQGFTNTVGQVALPNITRPSSLLILAKTNIIRTTQIGPIQGPIDAANGNGAGRRASPVQRSSSATATARRSRTLCNWAKPTPFSPIPSSSVAKKPSPR